MNLDATTKSVEVILGGAITTNQLEMNFDWVDMTTTTTTPGNTGSVTNNTTAVTAVAAPAASTQRKILRGNIYNADTVRATVTARVNDNSTMRRQVVVSLQPGYSLQYTDMEGWFVTNSSGATVVGTSSFSSITPVTALSISSGVVNIDCSLGDYFTLTLTANVTSITFSNLPVTGYGQTLIVLLKQDGTGSRTVALPGSFSTTGGSDTAVQSAANAYTLLAITTLDGGTRWEYAMRAG